MGDRTIEDSEQNGRKHSVIQQSLPLDALMLPLHCQLHNHTNSFAYLGAKLYLLVILLKMFDV
jgi:hypothetical protein